MRSKRIQIQELPWLLTRGRMTWAAGAALLIFILYIFQWTMAFCDPGGPERLFGLNRSGILYGCVWQFVSYLFLHHLSHPFGICFTLLGLVLIGSELEGIIGRAHFTMLFVCSGIVAGVGFFWVFADMIFLSGGPAISVVVFGGTPILPRLFLVVPPSSRCRPQTLLGAF